MRNGKLTDAEKLERRRTYQREYARQSRAGDHALNYIINVERAEKRRQATEKAKQTYENNLN